MSDPVPLNSSAIQSVQWNDDGTITVAFTSGASDTKPCDKATYEAFIASDSPGKFWNANFRGK